jgi:hypothetical protein
VRSLLAVGAGVERDAHAVAVDRLRLHAQQPVLHEPVLVRRAEQARPSQFRPPGRARRRRAGDRDRPSSPSASACSIDTSPPSSATFIAVIVRGIRGAELAEPHHALSSIRTTCSKNMCPNGSISSARRRCSATRTGPSSAGGAVSPSADERQAEVLGDLLGDLRGGRRPGRSATTCAGSGASPRAAPSDLRVGAAHPVEHERPTAASAAPGVSTSCRCRCPRCRSRQSGAEAW